MESQVNTSLFNMVMSLSDALDLVSPVVTGHHKRVAYISAQIAEKMKLGATAKKDILMAGALHDIGAFSFDQDFKILFSEEVEDFEKITKHAHLGAKLLDKFSPFAELANMVCHHHAYWEDTKEKDIPQESYILHLADRVEVALDEEKEILEQRSEIEKKLDDKKGGKFSPAVVDAFLAVSEVEAFWFKLVSDKIDRNLRQQVSETTINLTLDLLLGLAKIFGHIIDFQSSFTATHSSGVAATAEIMADLVGLTKADIKKIKIAGYFHDLGKLIVPNDILNKNGQLTEQEYNIVKQHPFYSYQILEGISELEEIKNWAAFHHERLDGSGYPFKLRESQLSVQARIMGVADVFTALMEDRPYRSGMDKEQALKILKNMVANGKLDGELVAILSDNFAEVNQLRKFVQQWERNQYSEFCSHCSN